MRLHKKALIVDGHNLLYASFFGMPDRIKDLNGRPVHAVYGFIASLLKMFRLFSPDLVAICFDAEQKTFRHDLFEPYKANRVPLTDKTNPFTQYSDILQALTLLQIPFIEKMGVEADDLIGSLAMSLANSMHVYIASLDRDMLMLVSDSISVYSRSRGKDQIYDVSAVVQKYGVLPTQFVDYKVLVGDRSDNIPGVIGIGPKTAMSLLQEYGDLQGIFDNIRFLKPRIASALLAHHDEIEKMTYLLRIKTDIHLDYHAQEISNEDKIEISLITVNHIMKELGLFAKDIS